MGAHCNSKLNIGFGWPQCLALIVCLLCLSSTSVKFAIGQDGASLQIDGPAVGVAPSPPVSPKTQADVDAGGTQQNAVAEAQSSVVGAQANAEQTNSEISAEEDVAALSNGVEESEESPPNNPDQIRSLSVKPGSQPLLPKDRPAWIGAEPDYSTERHRLFVGSVPMVEEKDVDRALDEPLLAALSGYLGEKVVNDQVTLNLCERLGITEDYIRRNLINDAAGHTIQLNTSSGPMYQKWVTVEITPAQREQIQAWHREAEQRQNVVPLGLGLALIIGLVGLSHLVLRRKHSLPTAQPLSREAVAQNLDSVVTPKRKRSVLSFLAVLICVLALPTIFFAAFFLVVSVAEYRETVSRAPVQVHEISTPAMPKMPAMPEMPVLQTMPKAEAWSDLHNSDSDVKLESNGQMIIIHKSHP